MVATMNESGEVSVLFLFIIQVSFLGGVDSIMNIQTQTSPTPLLLLWILKSGIMKFPGFFLNREKATPLDAKGCGGVWVKRDIGISCLNYYPLSNRTKHPLYKIDYYILLSLIIPLSLLYSIIIVYKELQKLEGERKWEIVGKKE